MNYKLIEDKNGTILLKEKRYKIVNEEIELLNKKIEAQDKIINTQALEIARLKEQLTMLVQDDERNQKCYYKIRQ